MLSPLAAGVAGAVQAISDLAGAGAGQRSTAQALRLALDQLASRPGARQGVPAVLTVYTDAADAGPLSAAELGAELRLAHVLLAVVSTNPDLRYWSRAAAASGGLVVRAGTDGAIAGFDQLADRLRARYLLTFRPPATSSRVTLWLDTGGGPMTATLALPRTRAPAADPACCTGSTPVSHRPCSWPAPAA